VHSAPWDCWPSLVDADPQNDRCGAPSAVFNAVVLAPSDAGVKDLLKMSAAIDWLRMAFEHLKIVGAIPGALPLFAAARVDPEADDGLVEIRGTKVADFIEMAKRHLLHARRSSCCRRLALAVRLSDED
jgi:catalase